MEEESRRIGDIIVLHSPFLKMYTDYVKNFGHAVAVVNAQYSKNQKFAAIMDEIHVSVEKRSVSLFSPFACRVARNVT
jgi:hypothetical protein